MFIYFPFLQTRMQSLHPEPGARYRNVMDALRQIVRTEGVWRPIRGVNVLAVGAGPAHALYFACYEKIKFSLSDAIHPGTNSHFANGKRHLNTYIYIKSFFLWFSNIIVAAIDSEYKINMRGWDTSRLRHNSISCSAGVAGCIATVLHDAIMNPAEGNTALFFIYVSSSSLYSICCSIKTWCWPSYGL